MSIDTAEVLVRCHIERTTLERWIDLAWVRPVSDEGGWQFSETDVARIDMICELHHDLGIDEEAIEVVLPLLDQVYGLRRQIRALTDALGVLPEEMRHQVLDRLDRPDRR